MTLTRWNPFRELDAILNQYNRAVTQNPWPSTSPAWAPSVDITENNDAFLIKAELPAVKKDDIKVEINQGVLTLSGERKQESRDEKAHRIERFYGSFSRSFTLPDNVEESAIAAAYQDGVLTLTLPKTVEAKPLTRTVTIQ